MRGCVAMKDLRPFFVTSIQGPEAGAAQASISNAHCSGHQGQINVKSLWSGTSDRVSTLRRRLPDVTAYMHDQISQA